MTNATNDKTCFERVIFLGQCPANPTTVYSEVVSLLDLFGMLACSALRDYLCRRNLMA